MRKVFLEQNLGKKTKCRFPKKNAKVQVIKLRIESQKAVSTPSLTQPLVIAGVSVIEFCDRFNQETVNYELGLLIKSKVLVNQTLKVFDLDLGTPTVYQLLKRVTVNFNNMKLNQLLQLLHNIAMIELVFDFGSDYFLKDFKSMIKQSAGTLRSINDFSLNRNKVKKRRRNGYLSTIN